MKISPKIIKLDESIKICFNNTEQKQLSRVITIVDLEHKENQTMKVQLEKARERIVQIPKTGRIGSGRFAVSRVVSSMGEKTSPTKMEMVLKNGEKAQLSVLDKLKAFILTNKDLIISIKEYKEGDPDQFEASLQELSEENAQAIKALSTFIMNPIPSAKPRAAGAPSKNALTESIIFAQQNAPRMLEIPERSNTPTAKPIVQIPEPIHLSDSLFSSWVCIPDGK